MRHWTLSTMLVGVCGWALICCGASAAEEEEEAAKLEIGSPAPPLSVAEWIKGEPVDIQSGKGRTIYVVEFWATWCGPCRVTIPHLTTLAQKYADKNVVFVGISSEPADEVRPFVQKQGEQMQYTVAVDKDGETDRAYRKAFKAPGIPHAFVIDKEGRIVWRGHPMMELDAVLRRLLAGTFDADVAKEVFAARPLVEQWVKEYHEKTPTTDAEKAEKAAIGERIVTRAAKDPYYLSRFAQSILSSKNREHRDLTLALRAAQAAYDADPGEPSVLAGYGQALFENGRAAQAVNIVRKAIELTDDPKVRERLSKALEVYEAASAQPGSSTQ